MLAYRRPTPLISVRAYMILRRPSTLVLSSRKMCWNWTWASGATKDLGGSQTGPLRASQLTKCERTNKESAWWAKEGPGYRARRVGVWGRVVGWSWSPLSSALTPLVMLGRVPGTILPPPVLLGPVYTYDPDLYGTLTSCPACSDSPSTPPRPRTSLRPFRLVSTDR